MSYLPKSEGARKATAMAIWGVITMSIGYGFMTLTTPTDEQVYARLSPELKRQFDRERKKRREDNDQSLQQLFNQRNLDRPAWRTDIPAEERDGEKQMIPLTLDSDAKVPPAERGVRK